jgi:uncharacterized protein
VTSRGLSRGARNARAARVVACLLACLALLLLLARPVHGQAGLDSVVPPSPVPDGFIHDGGPVLDAAALARLNARISEVQRATGGDIGVAIVRDLRGRAPVDVGVAIYRAWKIGHVDSIGAAGRALGALLLIVPKELAPDRRGQCWIATGRGAEGELTDSRAGSLCRDSIIPHLRMRDYAGAVSAGIDGIAATFRETVGDVPVATPTPTPVVAAVPATHGPGMAVVLWGALAGATGVAGAVGAVRAGRRRRPRLCPRGHGPMSLLDEVADDAALSAGQRAEERLGSVDYDVWACAACGERLIIPYTRLWSPVTGCPQCGFRTVRSASRTIRAASTAQGGLEESRLDCAHCGWSKTTLRETPRIVVAAATAASVGGGAGGWSGGGSGDGGSSGGGSSFGGSGETAGGGGGDSY